MRWLASFTVALAGAFELGIGLKLSPTQCGFRFGGHLNKLLNFQVVVCRAVHDLKPSYIVGTTNHDVYRLRGRDPKQLLVLYHTPHKFDHQALRAGSVAFYIFFDMLYTHDMHDLFSICFC